MTYDPNRTADTMSEKQIIYFHGTDPTAADTIRKEGFRPGTYFARHMEDAVVFGGLVVFMVQLEVDRSPAPGDDWQFCVQPSVPASAIRGEYKVECATPYHGAVGKG